MSVPRRAPGASADSLLQRMEQRLAVLEPENVLLTDDSAKHAGHAGAQSGGGHVDLVIVSSQFTGKTLQARHRMIYAALGELMGGEIHALGIKAYTADEI